MVSGYEAVCLHYWLGDSLVWAIGIVKTYSDTNPRLSTSSGVSMEEVLQIEGRYSSRVDMDSDRSPTSASPSKTIHKPAVFSWTVVRLTRNT